MIVYSIMCLKAIYSGVVMMSLILYTIFSSDLYIVKNIVIYIECKKVNILDQFKAHTCYLFS